MIALIAENLAPIMFFSLVLLLLLGYPVAFTLAAHGLIFFIIGVELAHLAPDQINLSWPLLQALPNRILDVMGSETLLAIPFFTFMGLVLERSGMAEDLLETVGQLFGPVRGGLAYAAILVGAVLAATTGVVAASVIAMGLISLPVMLRYGYSRTLATGSIAAAGTLAQIIPPSLVLIVMADQLGRSVGDMYAGALLPGLILTGIYCLYVFGLTLVNPAAAPAMPPETRTLGPGGWSLPSMVIVAVGIAYGATMYFSTFVTQGAAVWGAAVGVLAAYAAALGDHWLKLGLLSRLTQQIVMVLIPPLALIFLVLGTIFLGIATPTEGGAMGAAGAVLLAFAKGRLSFDMLRQSVEATARLATFVMFILIGARVFSLTFYGVNGHVWIENLLLNLPGGQIGFLIFVNILVFVLGCFLDFFEIAFIVIPLLAPVAAKLDIDLIWFGVIIAMNLQTSFLTPPFGFALFYLRSIAPASDYVDKLTGRAIKAVGTLEIYRGAIAFIVLQAIMIAIVIAFPGLVTHYKEEGPKVDPATIEIPAPVFGKDGPAPPSGLSLPPGGPAGLGLPTAPPSLDLGKPPEIPAPK
ncbi:MAG: hypothetical protein RLZ98_22 [Pseudomonadota bacterium]|jgi:TRAP-type mannitol/chloroaromatic compound transport system permease large subunit